MKEMELRIVSDHRDGLLTSLGEILVAHRYNLLRHRRQNTEAGVVMTLVVQGPEDRLLLLEEQLGNHWMVKSLEAGPYDPNAAPSAVAAPAASVASPAVSPSTSTPAQTPAPTSATRPALDQKRIESLLPQIARDYPNVFGLVTGLERSFDPSQREAGMRYVGTRLGSWVYKRDYALGAPLPLSGSIRHIALPALRQLLPAEIEGDTLVTASSPFCTPQATMTAPQCHFLRGFLEGLLNTAGHLGNVRVSETECRANGAALCCLVFHV